MKTRSSSLRILRADHMGMCFGVRDAIALAHREAAAQPLTVLGDLVHNETVLTDLRRRGVRLEQNLDDVATRTVLITAHGASERRLAEVAARGHRLVEATCPLVHHAHRALRSLVESGFHPVVVGRRDHVEVRGMTEDLAVFDVILAESDVDALAPRDRFGVVAQTTQPLERVRGLVDRLRLRFPQAEVRFVDTVCLPTKQRQNAAEQLARTADVVVVIGGAQSNNTKELAVTCRAHGARVHQVVSAAEMREEWFRPGETVGITAGTSTPPVTILGVERWLNALAWRWESAQTPCPSLETAAVS
ncbi:MAG: 4-hydroxy-3-methylbut-2-enyl diphosphate reductase [Verrucomicrobiales bacterium]|nr:4-hydroxy-3-methylbut-2-enyl diphosphate reductase [Verrucomicrobiales bacterium]